MRTGRSILKIVVIGAGIIGASIAFNLSRRKDCGVTIVERNIPGLGASAHSFAWTNSFGKEPRDYHALNRNSMEMCPRFVESLGVPQALHAGGELHIENTVAGAETLTQHVKRLQSWGYPCRLIEWDVVRTLEPSLVAKSVTAASFAERDGHVDAASVIEACMLLAQEAGARLIEGTPVTGLRLDDGNSVRAVVTPSGDLECDQLVVAGGTDTSALAAMAGVTIPQPVSPGVVVRTDPRPPLLKSLSVLHLPRVTAEREEIHLRQAFDGTVRIGQGTQESLSRDDSQAHADDLLDRATGYLPALAGAKAFPESVGIRPMPADGLPVLGFAEKAPNLYLALMHSGITLAPLVGELAALEILDGAKIDTLLPYRVERFSRT